MAAVGAPTYSPSASSRSFSNIGSAVSISQPSAGDGTNVGASTSSGVPPSAHPTNVLVARSEAGSSERGGLILCLIYTKNKLAAAGYNSSTGQMYVLESVAESSELCTSMLALRSLLPAVVLVPSAGAAKFVKSLKDKLEGDQLLRNVQFQRLASRYCTYGFARRTVLESPMWEGCYTFRTEDAKRSVIVNYVNLNDERLVCAVGGLLYQTSTGCPQLCASYPPVPILSVHQLSLNSRLWMDNESFKSLQIFDPIEHPSAFNWSLNLEQGKSVFALLERHCSSVGLTRLKTILANPINCRTTLLKRHEVINFYLDPKNRSVIETLRTYASQMYSSTVVMGYLSSPTLRGGQWKHIYRHIYYTVSYAEVCRSHESRSSLFRELGSTIVDDVYSMAHNLERVVDLVNMENNETFVLKYGFHPPLDAAKEKFSRLKVAMDKVTPYEFDTVPSYVTRIQMMYIPEMKFMLSIPFWSPDLTKDDLQLPNLEFKFTANKIAFYKSRRCCELDELLGDAQTDITNEESLIIQSLRNYLKSHMHHIVAMSQMIAEIECLFAMGKVAREDHYSMPQLLTHSAMEVRGCWHPLLGLPSSQVITNDLVSSTDTSLVKLVHGPNASGKSVYLKQIGLLMYLVHVGSFVPAAFARVGLLERIIARTAKEESVISMSSTMLSELRKLQVAVIAGGRHSLVILDEVGRGSTETNCVGILAAALNHFLRLGDECPHVIVSTHLSGLSEFVHRADSPFELLSMEYTLDKGDLVFLYKALRGRSDGCFLFEMLENCEFATPILSTARTVLQSIRTGDNLLPYCGSRLQRSHKYLSFIRKFANIDMTKPGYLEKLQNKVQRYYEKPS